MIRSNAGNYLSELMDMDLSLFFGRERYEHTEGKRNHCFGPKRRDFTLKLAFYSFQGLFRRNGDIMKSYPNGLIYGICYCWR